MTVSDPNLQAFVMDGSFVLFPATACQTRFWLEQRAAPQASALNVAFRLQLTAAVDSQTIETALHRLIARHEILRTRFVMSPEGLKQQVWSTVDFHLGVIDLQRLDAPAQKMRIEETGQAEALTPFPLTAQSFFRATWLPKSQDDSELLLTFHSLVMDGWSFAIFVREFLDVLSALHHGKTSDLADVELHHGDYTLWKQEFLASSAIAPSVAYWREELKGFKRFDVPGDRQRPTVRRHKGAIRSILLPADLTDRLNRLAKDRGLTLFSLAASSLAAALYKTTGQPHVALSTQVSVRDQQELESVLGPLINTVVLRLDAAEDPSLAELAAQCSHKLSHAITHVHVPFEDMMTMTGEAVDPARPPLCSVNLALQQSFIGLGEDVRRDELVAVAPPSFNAGALYDLSFFMVSRPEGWRISCEGDIDLFDSETILAHVGRWQAALEAMARQADQPMSRSLDIPVVPNAALKQGLATTGSGFMSEARFRAAVRNIVRYNEGAQGTPVIALNNVAVFYDLSQQIGTDRPLIDIPMTPEGGPRHIPMRAFEDIAADAVRLIRAAQPKGPYCLMGLCVLGALAFEAARQLRREGETVELVVLNDSWCPGYRETMPWYDRMLRKFQVRAYNIPRDFGLALKGEISLIEYLKSYRILRALRIVDIAQKFGWLKDNESIAATDENRWYTEYLQAQQSRYRPEPYDGDVQVFRSQQPRRGRLFAHALGWEPIVTGTLTVTEVPAMHSEMFRTGGAVVIGKQLRDRLAKESRRAAA